MTVGHPSNVRLMARQFFDLAEDLLWGYRFAIEAIETVHGRTVGTQSFDLETQLPGIQFRHQHRARAPRRL
jgi:hypothetical protein